MDERGLLDLKKQIEEAKQKTAELKGQQIALMKQLKEEWKCETIEEAEILLAKMNEDIKTLDGQIAQGLKELENKYNE